MFQITYHHLVKKDVSGLSDEWKRKIKKAIDDRLSEKPELYGRPLRKSLKGYLKLRVGDYRVIFSINKNKVKILIIGHRSRVYSQVEKRI